MQVIAHNILAMNAQTQFQIAAGKRGKAAEKLSSGYRINRAADDAAGLTISEKMRRQIRGLDQGIENTQDGVSLCQVADGALFEVGNMIQRINQLSIQSANGTNSVSDRESIQEEVTQILKEIDRIGETTAFNERRIFYDDKSSDISASGTGSIQTSGHSLTRAQAIAELQSGNFSVGKKEIIRNGQTISTDMIHKLAQAYSSEYLWYHYQDICMDSGARDEVTRTFQLMCENAKGHLEGRGYGADASGRYTQDEIEQMTELVSQYITNLNQGVYRSIDEARQAFSAAMPSGIIFPSQMLNLKEMASLYYFGTPKKEQDAIDNEAGMARADADTILRDAFGDDFVNSCSELCKPFYGSVDDSIDRYIALADMESGETVKDASSEKESFETTQIWIQSGCDAGDGIALSIDKMSTRILGIHHLDISTQEGAIDAIMKTEDALAILLAQRSKIGAQQNRLEHTIVNEENIVENTTAAESGIRDTDMVEAMLEFSTSNILIQAGQAMIAQANQQKDVILQLLS